METSARDGRPRQGQLRLSPTDDANQPMAGNIVKSVREHASVPAGVKRFIEKFSMLTKDDDDSKTGIVDSPDAVCLVSGGHSGTTWTQQIMHGLRSRGDMSFQEIDEEVVHIAAAAAMGERARQQKFRPLMYKAHWTYEECPRGFGKYIILTRNPKDAAISGYRHFCDWFFTKDELSLEDFVEYLTASEIPTEYARLNGFHLRHQASWYPHRKDPNVLWLHYEDLSADLGLCVRLISDFLGIGVGDQELLDLVERQASFDFMALHKSKFLERQQKLQVNEKLGLPPGAGLAETNSKVRIGRTNGWKMTLPKELADAVDDRWRSFFAPICEYTSYEDMRKGINAELERHFSA